MNPIFQMHLEIIDAHFRPRGVQFARAVLALDAWVVHVLDVFGRGRVGPDGDGHVGCGADSGVAHCAFEGVVGVVLLQALEGAREPGRRGWLG